MKVELWIDWILSKVSSSGDVFLSFFFPFLLEVEIACLCKVEGSSRFYSGGGRGFLHYLFQWGLNFGAVSPIMLSLSPSSLLRCGCAMQLRVVSQGSGVDFRVPVMILIAWRSWMSIFGVCELRSQTQGHSIQPRYNRVPERKFLVQMARRPKLFQLCFQKVKVLSKYTPSYLRVLSSQ